MTLPNFLEEETEATILQRMLGNVPDDLDCSEGSYIYDALAAVTQEVVQLKINMAEYLRRGFASTTFGEYLNLRCEEHGLARRPAVKASGQVVFFGVSGTAIYSGTRVAVPANLTLGIPAIEFVTREDATVGTGGTTDPVNIEAVLAGTSGNVLAHTITALVTNVSGIFSVVNSAPTIGGEDIEKDSILLSRYLTKVRTPGTSGNKADYRNWALEIAGVGDAQVIPVWNGNGTVKVVLIDDDKNPAVQSVIDDVQNHISPNPELGEGRAPIGADVTVAAAEAVAINVSATVIRTGIKTLDEIKEAFEAELTDYIKSIAFSSDPTVRYVRIGSLLFDTQGVQDYFNLSVNSGISNVSISTGQVAVTGTVTLNE